MKMDNTPQFTGRQGKKGPFDEGGLDGFTAEAPA